MLSLAASSFSRFLPVVPGKPSGYRVLGSGGCFASEHAAHGGTHPYQDNLSGRHQVTDPPPVSMDIIALALVDVPWSQDSKIASLERVRRPHRCREHGNSGKDLNKE